MENTFESIFFVSPVVVKINKKHFDSQFPPERLLILLLQLLQVGGTEVKLSVDGTEDIILLLSSQWTLTQSGLEGEWRHIWEEKEVRLQQTQVEHRRPTEKQFLT